MRTPLPNGYNLVLNSGLSTVTITIKETIGEGGCCIAYKGDLQMSTPIPVIVKECFPAKLALKRDEDKCSIIPENDDDREQVLVKFSEKKARFREGLYSTEKIRSLNDTNEITNDENNDFFIYGEKNNTSYCFSHFKNGKILTEYVKDKGGILSISETAEMVISICKAVQRYHLGGYLYLDTKPDNILVSYDSEGRIIARVIDFDSIISIMDEREIKNNPCSYSKGWAAPEQMNPGEPLSYKTDVFSIGAVFYWCLTGKNPYEVPENIVDFSKIDYSILDQLKTEDFWRANSEVCAAANSSIINIIKGIAEKALSKDQKSRGYCRFRNELNDMMADLTELAIVSKKRESSNKVNILKQSNNRFRYNSNSTVFRGRQEEMKLLVDMCNSSEQFQWIGICGKGGTGKSRIAYELCSKMMKQYWQVYPPMRFHDNLYKYIDDPSDNILICLDYIKQDMDRIINLIQSIIDYPFERQYKIRIVLIEREENDVRINDSEINRHRYSTPLILQPITEEEMRRVVIDYIITQKAEREVTKNSLDLIIDTLRKVDSEYRRPIYALFIADAWINSEELSQWDRNDALDYLLEHELRRLRDQLNNPDYDLDIIKRSKYSDAIKYLYALATYLGKINIVEYDQKLNELFGIDSDDEKLRALIKEFGILSTDTTIEGWEPDLIGEYYCIKYLDSIYERFDIERVKDFIRTVTNKDINSLIRYSDMIYKDYSDLASEYCWMDVITEVKLPSSYTEVRKNMFEGRQFLKHIVFEGRVNIIYANAFKGCINLERITFPSSLEIIEKMAFSGCTNLSSVDLEDSSGKNPSIIRIEEYAFQNCISLLHFTIPESTQKIGTAAFENCESLVKIEIPRKICNLENNVFSGCRSLSTVAISETSKGVNIMQHCFDGCENLTTIENCIKILSVGDSAFRNCFKIEALNFGGTLESLSDNAFWGCASLKCIDLSMSKIPLLNRNLFYGCKALNKVSLPKTIYNIQESCFFKCEQLIEIELYDGIVTIGQSAFSGCSNLKSIRMPLSLRKIGMRAFENCSELSEISFKSEPEVIEAQAFIGCDHLTYSSVIGLSINNNPFCGFVFSEFSENEFSFVKNIALNEDIVVPDTTICIGDDSFIGCENLRNITIPVSVDKIGDRAFKNCINLSSIKCNDNSIKTIGEYAFSGCASLTEISGSLAIEIIPKGLFENCRMIESIRFSSRIDNYGDYAFHGCSRLKSLLFDNYIVPHSIGIGAFWGCNNLTYPIKAEQLKKSHIRVLNCVYDGFIFNRITDTEINFLNDYNKHEVMEIPDSCVSISKVRFSEIIGLRKIIIPDSVLSLPASVFEDCSSLEVVVLPANLRKLPFQAFMNCKSLNTIIFKGHNPNVIPDGVTIESAVFYGCANLRSIVLPTDISSISMLVFYGCSSIKTIDIPFNVKQIEKCAFQNCNSLTSVTLHSSLTELGSNAFSGCKSLTKVLNFENTQVSIIHNNTFYNCTHLEYIVLPSGLTTIRGHAFFNCQQLKIPCTFIPDSVVEIETSVFQGCSSIERIRLPSQIKSIERYLFKDCISLQEVIIPDCVEKIGQSAFYNCCSLNCDEKFLPSSLKTIETGAFAYCSSLKKVIIPDSVVILPEELFKGCSSLVEAHIPDTITEISIDCFKDCYRLQSVNIPDTVKYIHVGAFRNCRSWIMENLILPEGLTKLEESAFRYCDSLQKVTIPEQINSIQSGAFEGCKNLKEVAFDHVITYIRTFAFFGCESLIHFPFHLVGKEICSAAFGQCKSLQSPVFSDSICKIKVAAFSDCSSIKEVVLPSSIRAVAVSAFSNNINLENVIVPVNVSEIRSSAFEGCINLTKVELKSNKIKIADCAFMGCERLNYIEIPKTNRIHKNAFKSCPLEYSLNENDSISWYFEDEEDEEEYDQLFSVFVDEDRKLLILKKYFGSTGKLIVVPEQIDGIPVVEIGSNCFKGLSGVETIVLPDTLETIGKHAFSFCTSLKRIIIPKSVKSIGDYAFRDCFSLSEIVLPESITTIPKGLFMYCWNLSSVTFGNCIEIIKERAFYSCPEIKMIIPDSVKVVEPSAFAKCDMNKIQVSNSFSDDIWEDRSELYKDNPEVKDYQFKYTKTMTNDGIILNRIYGYPEGIVIVPNVIDGQRVVAIGNSCFEECFSIEEVYLPDTIERIGTNAFAYCKKLKKINLPHNIKNIGGYAFKDCYSLSEVILPDSLKAISEGTFMFCWSLTRVMLPNQLKKIEKCAFLSCPELYLNVPAGIQVIEPGAFARCTPDRISFTDNQIDQKWFE